MLRYSAKLIKLGFAASAATLPVDLVLIPQSWSASDRGGCTIAELTASGSAESLAYLCGWLGDRVEIYNDAGDLCWWGVLWDLEVNLGNIQVALSIDNIYNRVAVTYPYTLADGSQESRTTAWVEDENSILHYGTRELLYGMPESIRDSADVVRDTLLRRLSEPGPVISTQTAIHYDARLTAMGSWQRAASVYFTNLDGLEEHTDENGSVVIGHYQSSNQISFGTSTPGGEADEMHIASGNFDALAIDDTFTISGAAQGANNDTFTVVGKDAADQVSISGTFAAEAVGATIRISFGDQVAQDNIAMSFQLDTAWTVTHVAVKTKRIGTPTDNFRIGIYPDSAGAPGTVLTVNETLGSALFTELTWTEFAFATPVALAANTTYWIGIRRTGSANVDDGYEVAIDENLGYGDGVFRVYNGTTWVAHDPPADMPFRVIGEIDSTAQLSAALDMVGQFSNTLVQVDSNVPVRPFRDIPRPALDEINDMLDIGTSTEERLVAWVTPNDAVVVDVAIANSNENLILGDDGKVRFLNGALYPPGRLIYGRYVDLESLLLLDSVGIRSSRGRAIYITGSTYQADTDTLSVQTLGALDPYQALTTIKG